jgi:hypothetical protein
MKCGVGWVAAPPRTSTSPTTSGSTARSRRRSSSVSAAAPSRGCASSAMPVSRAASAITRTRAGARPGPRRPSRRPAAGAVPARARAAARAGQADPRAAGQGPGASAFVGDRGRPSARGDVRQQVVKGPGRRGPAHRRGRRSPNTSRRSGARAHGARAWRARYGTLLRDVDWRNDQLRGAGERAEQATLSPKSCLILPTLRSQPV